MIGFLSKRVMALMGTWTRLLLNDSKNMYTTKLMHAERGHLNSSKTNNGRKRFKRDHAMKIYVWDGVKSD